MALMASPYEGIDMPLICLWGDVTSGGVEIVLRMVVHECGWWCMVVVIVGGDCGWCCIAVVIVGGDCDWWCMVMVIV